MPTGPTETASFARRTFIVAFCVGVTAVACPLGASPLEPRPATPVLAAAALPTRPVRPADRVAVQQPAAWSAPQQAAQSPARTGEISGRVVDARNGQPLPGATVRVGSLGTETITDARGDFVISAVVAGTVEVTATAAGYRTSPRAAVVVRSGERTSVTLQLTPETVRLDEQVEVVGQLPRQSESQPGTAFTLTGTRLTTMSGTLGDFGRTLRTVPAAAGTSDERNTVVARGGNPIENGFFIDNIEVPNISHLPDWASTGGLYSLIDPSAVGTADFVVGGFPAKFGGFLSSITDIAYREGSRDRVRGQARFDIAMAAAAAEGPLPGGRGSWRVSLRHADFLYLKEVINLDDQNPRWTDAHVKVVYDLSPRHSLALIDVLSTDRLLEQHGNGRGERTKIDQNTAGLNWRASWSDRFRSETSASYSTYTRYEGQEYQPPEDEYDWAIDHTTDWFAVRNDNTWSFGDTAVLQFGAQARRYTHDVGYLAVPTRPGTILFSTGPWRYRTTESAAFVSSTVHPLQRLATTAGVRAEHSTASGRTHVSPRLSASYRLSKSWQINGAAAIVHQALPADFLALSVGAVSLRDMRADQYSVGLGYSGSQGWRAAVEVYDKRYSALPLDQEATHRLILDREPFRDYNIPVYLIDTGKGHARGVEVMIERRIGRQFSGVLAARASRNTYRDARGVERDRLFDSRYAVSVAADWTPTDRWSLSSTLVVQGGTPYTPTHVRGSIAWGTWVRDASQYNGVRYPDYVTLNARVERRFTIGRATLAVFGDVWNLLDRQNIGWIDGWSQSEGDIFEYQMPRTPFVGIGVVF